MTSVSHSASPSGSAWIAVALAACTATLIIILQWHSIINPDVAFLLWTAAKVTGPAVFGVDVYEVNPPLAFLIYSPAALAAPVFGFGLALTLWISGLAALSVITFWQCCDPALRLALTLALALFITLVFPGQFAQREYIAFLLTAPYVAGPARSRGFALLSGVMAGVGFAIKPYFLIPLVLVFATRRRIRREELAIAATGAAYALGLLLFFQPYLFDFLPLARATYWAAHHLDRSGTWWLSGIILLTAVLFSLAGAPQPSARGFLAATLGFVAAAVVQYKGFTYHFHAAWGFLTLFLTARAFNTRRIVALCAALYLLVYGVFVAQFTRDWFILPQDNQLAMAELLPEIDRSPSFLALAMGSFPAFPTALHTASEYKGLAIWPIFISAALEPSATPEVRAMAERLTHDQAIRELQRQPALVIVKRPGAASGWGRKRFDLLGWLATDLAFHTAWSAYRYDKTIGDYELYRRKP